MVGKAGWPLVEMIYNFRGKDAGFNSSYSIASLMKRRFICVTLSHFALLLGPSIIIVWEIAVAQYSDCTSKNLRLDRARTHVMLRKVHRLVLFARYRMCLVIWRPRSETVHNVLNSQGQWNWETRRRKTIHFRIKEKMEKKEDGDEIETTIINNHYSIAEEEEEEEEEEEDYE